MASYNRTKRIAEEIKKVISTMLISGIKDPRITSMVSVTDVEVTNDLSYAKVFVSFLCKDERNDAGLKTLNRARGFIRSELAKRVKVYKVPELTFVLDKSLENAKRIEDIINRVNQK